MSRYVGMVTDRSWYLAVLRTEPVNRIRLLNERPVDLHKIDEGYDFIYSCKRFPRFYLDEQKYS